MQTLLEVMQAVAEQYYPQRKDALLEIKVPYLLKVIYQENRLLRDPALQWKRGFGRWIFLQADETISTKTS